LKKALITGGAGFIGYHLGRSLLESYDVIHLIDNFSRGVRDDGLLELTRHKGVDLLDLDLLDIGALEKLAKDYDVIFHLAAIIGVQHVLRVPYDVLTKNVRLLQNMIELGKRQSHLRRLVFASTSEVYAGTLKQFSLTIPTPEDVPLALTDIRQKRTSYMLSKIYGEAMCLHSPLPVTIVRPHNFYGPRMGLSHVIPELCAKAFNSTDDKLDVFSITHKRTFCYIDDAVEMIVRLSESERAVGEAFNVGREAPEVSIEEVAREVIRVVGKPLTICPQPETEGSPKRRCPKMSKTMAVAGCEPQVDLDEGIRRTFEWYKENVFVKRGLTAV